MIGFGEGKGIRPQEKRLFSNTVFLYLLTFSTQLFSFITVPYLSRVLGPTVFGKVGIAQAYMSYVQIILDFGLILSATRIANITQNARIRTVSREFTIR